MGQTQFCIPFLIDLMVLETIKLGELSWGCYLHDRGLAVQKRPSQNEAHLHNYNGHINDIWSHNDLHFAKWKFQRKCFQKRKHNIRFEPYTCKLFSWNQMLNRCVPKIMWIKKNPEDSPVNIIHKVLVCEGSYMCGGLDLQCPGYCLGPLSQ